MGLFARFWPVFAGSGPFVAFVPLGLIWELPRVSGGTRPAAGRDLPGARIERNVIPCQHGSAGHGMWPGCERDIELLLLLVLNLTVRPGKITVRLLFSH